MGQPGSCWDKNRRGTQMLMSLAVGRMVNCGVRGYTLEECFREVVFSEALVDQQPMECTKWLN